MMSHQYGNNGGDGPGPIPQRWLGCPRKSEVLISNKFLALKTPLGTKFNDQVPLIHRFTPSMLFQSMKSYNVNIGLWIDLTNTTRFYDKKEVEDLGCRHVKLSCKGHGETPSKESVETFIRICSNFLARCPLQVIAVHCTHGFNRTGFMISSYLVEQEDHSIEFAVQQFATARVPGIYKQEYLEELFHRYGDGEPAPTAPELPSWHTECDDDDHESGGGGGGGGGGRRKGREKNKSNPVFMEGVPKVVPVLTQPKLSNVRRKIQEMTGFKSSGFPGCQPVSMSRDNITMLMKAPYYVSWKADGTRYMMLIDGKGEIYFADRDNSIFQAPDVEFKDKDDLNVNLKDTLLDGEMVIDTDPKNGKKYPRYLIYDLIRIRGRDVSQDSFRLRWERIIHDVIKPRNAAIMKGIIDKTKEPFSVRRKDFWEATAQATHKLLSDNFQKQLTHEPDGLIFHPDNEPYMPGRCDTMLKWKPPSHNSVDFKLKIVKKGGEGMLTKKIGELYVGSFERPFGEIKYTKQLAAYDGKIIECNVSERGEWLFMRERTDKSFPNSYTTALAVSETIRSPVTQQYLLDFLHNSGYKKPDSQVMPPPGPPPNNSHHQHRQPPPANNYNGSQSQQQRYQQHRQDIRGESQQHHQPSHEQQFSSGSSSSSSGGSNRHMQPQHRNGSSSSSSSIGGGISSSSGARDLLEDSDDDDDLTDADQEFEQYQRQQYQQQEDLFQQEEQDLENDFHQQGPSKRIRRS